MDVGGKAIDRSMTSPSKQLYRIHRNNSTESIDELLGARMRNTSTNQAAWITKDSIRSNPRSLKQHTLAESIPPCLPDCLWPNHLLTYLHADVALLRRSLEDFTRSSPTSHPIRPSPPNCLTASTCLRISRTNRISPTYSSILSIALALAMDFMDSQSPWHTPKSDPR